MKVVLSGGGTSGHVNPALAVARVLSDRGVEILYVGTESGPERRLVDRAGVEFEAIDIVGRERGLSRKNLVAAAKLVKATWRSAKILGAADPWVVLGTGGYVSLPVIIAAWLHQIPLVVHEQNSVLGLANRLARRFAKAVAVSFPETMAEARGPVVLTGNPVRRPIVEVGRQRLRARALETLELEPNRSTLLIAGGSQGAASINGAAFEAYDDWRNDERMQVVHIVGPGNIEAARVTLAERSRYSDRIIWKLFSYLDQMELAYAAADLAVCRAGATTVAELAVTGVPALLVPYPYSLDQDQRRNAEAMARAGAAELIVDSELNGPVLSDRVGALLYDDTALARMSEGMKSRAVPDADIRLAELVEAAAMGSVSQPEPAEDIAFPDARLRLGLRLDEAWRRIHLVGIGGAGMSALARILIEAGVSVSGSDRSESSTAESLRRIGATVWVGHSSGRMQGVDAVLTSSAIPADNVELTEAATMGIPVLSRGEAIARIVQGRKTIAISGTHGKTTTSAMTASILQVAGRDPLYIVGGPFGGGSGGHLGIGGEWAVVEADEAFGSFLLLQPEIAAVTNIDEDHLDFHGGLDGLLAAFSKFISNANHVVLGVDDPAAAKLAAGAGDRLALTYGFAEAADVRASEIQWDATRSRFKLTVSGAEAGWIRLPVGGRHNVQNALAAAACSLASGVEVPEILEGLESFSGVGRRFELRGSLRGAELRDDYAHNPAELAAALSQAGAGSWSRVIAVFQPHLYSRTRALWRELGEAISAADVAVVTDVDGAREQPVAGISGKMVVDAACEAAPGKRVVYLPSLEEAAEFVRREARNGDLVLTLGCGYVNKLHDLVERDDAA